MQCEHTLMVPADHPAFAGHFPGVPILPGVVLLDAVVHLARGASAGVCQIASAKFLSPVSPGELLTISYISTTASGIRFDIVSGARKVVTGTLVLAA